MEPRKLAEIAGSLDTDEAADLIQHIEELDETKAEAVLANLPTEDSDVIKKLISYEDYEAGAYMQAEVFDAHLDETIEDSIVRLKKMN